MRFLVLRTPHCRAISSGASFRKLAPRKHAVNREIRGGLVPVPSSISGSGPTHGRSYRFAALVAVQVPRSLLILRTSNVGSPESALAFLPRSSTRSPGFNVSCCRSARLYVWLSLSLTSLSPLPLRHPCSLV